MAAAFKVGLIVRFVPISELVEWELGLTSESLKAVSFDQDEYFKEKPKEDSLDQTREPIPEDFSETTPDSKIIKFGMIANEQPIEQTNIMMAGQS